MTNSIKIKYLIIIAIITLWFIIPILSIPIILYIAFNHKFPFTTKEKYFILFIISLSFGLIAYTVDSAGFETSDVVRYRDIYKDAIGQNIRDISTLNYIFNLINWFLANYISSNGQFMSLFWGSITMLFTLLASFKIIKYFFEDNGDLYYILMLLCIIIIPFITITEMIKETVAFSIFMFAITKKISNEKNADYYFLISLLIHPVSIILISITYFFTNKYISKYIILILIISLFFSFVNYMDFMTPLTRIPLFNILDLAEKINTYKDWSQWGGSKRYYIISGIVFLQVEVYIWQYYKQKNIKNELSILGILIVSVLLFNMANPHDLARLIFVFFPFQIIITLLDIKSFNINFDKKIVIVFLFIFYISNNSIYTYKQLNSSESRQSYMNNNLSELLTSNFVDFIQYKVK